MKRTILFATLTFLAVTQRASAVPGTQLQEACANYTDNSTTSNTSSVSSLNAGICMGYIMSAIDSYPIINVAYPTVKFCAPKEVDYAQEIKVVTKFLNNHPEVLHKPATMLVIAAMSIAFPCK